MNGNQPYDMDNSDRKLSKDYESDASLRRSQGNGDSINLKILVPSVAAGAIIGKGGEAIAQIQKSTGSKVKMSKANDCYPGTNERVCLISGNVESVMAVHDYIMEKILEKPDSNTKNIGGDSRGNIERHKQVKILVPNSTAGMIIGKAGAFIKEIKDKSGSYIQISQKSKEVSLPERCVTIAGDLDKNKVAVEMIIDKIVEDPQSSSCLNISYADVSGPVASAYPTGSPYAIVNQNSGSVTSGTPSLPLQTPPGPSTPGISTSTGAGPTVVAMAPSLNSSLNSSGGLSLMVLENLAVSLRSSGFSEEAVQEITSAICVLANYGFLNLSSLGIMAASPGLTTPSTPVPMMHSPGSSFNLSGSLHHPAGGLHQLRLDHDFTASAGGSGPFTPGATPGGSQAAPYTMYTGMGLPGLQHTVMYHPIPPNDYTSGGMGGLTGYSSDMPAPADTMINPNLSSFQMSKHEYDMITDNTRIQQQLPQAAHFLAPSVDPSSSPGAANNTSNKSNHGAAALIGHPGATQTQSQTRKPGGGPAVVSITHSIASATGTTNPTSDSVSSSQATSSGANSDSNSTAVSGANNLAT